MAIRRKLDRQAPNQDAGGFQSISETPLTEKEPEGQPEQLFWEGAPSQSGMSPRENPTLGGGNVARRSAPGSMAAPSMPKSPSPVAGVPGGGVSGGALGGGGVLPFDPMPRPAASVMTRSPRGGSLYGSLGGLQGGGLGLPLDPTSNQKSDPISTLLKLLKGGF